MRAAPAPERHVGLGRAVLVFTLAGTVALFAFVLVYCRFAGPIVDALDEELGEVLMRRAMQFEGAGEVENAKEMYLEALERPFHGQQNRADTLKRLGTLYWMDGQPDAALPYLRNASEFDNPPRSVFEPLLDSLITLNRLEEADKTLQRWIELIGAEKEELAKAKYYVGKLALLCGDKKRAEVAFLEGLTLVPGGRNASELATLYFLDNRFDQALPYVNQYLETGSGQRAEYMRWVRAKILGSQELSLTPSTP